MPLSAAAATATAPRGPLKAGLGAPWPACSPLHASGRGRLAGTWTRQSDELLAGACIRCTHARPVGGGAFGIACGAGVLSRSDS